MTVDWEDFGPTETPVCAYCHRTPDEIPEYTDYAVDAGMTNTQYVLAEEGTLNPRNNHFACDECYIRIGTPSGVDGRGGPGRWVAP